jgi:hypothetical protein
MKPRDQAMRAWRTGYFLALTAFAVFVAHQQVHQVGWPIEAAAIIHLAIAGISALASLCFICLAGLSMQQ